MSCGSLTKRMNVGGWTEAGHVVNLEQLAALGRRRIGQLSIFDEFVEDARRHTHVLLFRYELDHIGQAVDALLGQGRGEEDGRILEEGPVRGGCLLRIYGSSCCPFR